MHPAACGFCQQGTAWARRAGVYGTGRSQKTLPPNAQRDRLAGDNRARNRLIETEVDVTAFAVAFRGPMGWLPNRLPAALRSGFRTRCRPVGSRRGVAPEEARALADPVLGMPVTVLPFW